MNRTTLPRILYHRNFNEDTFSVKKVDIKIQLSAQQLKGMDKRWKDYEEGAKSKGNRVWNGTFYRLENIDDFEKELELSTISYSTIRGLTYNNDLSTIPPSSWTNHISTNSLIKTSDGLFVLGRRGANTMSKLKVGLIGGGLQPEEQTVDSGSDIFDNQRREMEEELGISSEEIRLMRGIGIVHSAISTVTFIFYSELSIEKSQLLKAFDENSDDEIRDLEFVTEKDLRKYLISIGGYLGLVGELSYM